MWLFWPGIYVEMITSTGLTVYQWLGGPYVDVVTK